MGTLPTLLGVICLIGSVYSKGKHLDCNEELRIDDDRSKFESCCKFIEEDQNWQTIHAWGPEIDVDDACQCSVYLALDNMINYWDIHYCRSRIALSDKYWPTMMIFVWLPVILLLFSLIGSTADAFFVPTLEELSNVLKLSPSVAGATLIALANGAPDFFCSIAGMSGNQQPELVVGGIIGSAMIISVFIFGTVIFVAPYQSTKRLFLRDTLFLFCVVVLLGIVIHGKTIQSWWGYVMFCIYAIYVLVVIFNKDIIKQVPETAQAYLTKTDLFEPKFRKHSLVINRKDSIQSNSMMNSVPSTSHKTTNVDVVRELDITSDEDQDEDPENPKETEPVTENAETETNPKNTDKGVETETVTIKSGESSQSGSRTIAELGQPIDEYDDEEDGVLVDKFDDRTCSNIPQFVWDYFKHVVEWDNQNCFGKVLILLESPFTMLRIISVPLIPDDEAVYSREWIVFTLICAPSLIMFSFVKSFLLPPTPLVHIPMYLASLLFGLVSYLFFIKPAIPDKEHRVTRGFIACIGLMCCASWIMMFANELLALLDVIGIGMGMNEKAIGYTFLAMGNSVPDLMVNVSSAKNGDQQAAITACFAGTIFNILCSFGVAIAFTGFEGMHVNGGFEGGYRYTFTYSFVIIGLIFNITKSMTGKYYLGKSTGIACMIWYFTFLSFVIWGGFATFNPPTFIMGGDD